VTQETWLAIVRGISRLSDPARFKSWAYRIATNKARDWIAGAVEARRVPAELASGEPEECEPPRRETSDELQTILARLPQDGRAVLTLYYLEGFAVADIATILHVPPGTVKSRLHNARNELKILWLQDRHKGDNHEK
jgi:RNA polymerase sigma-70 factor (ECF subfamily)